VAALQDNGNDHNAASGASGSTDRQDDGEETAGDDWPSFLNNFVVGVDDQAGRHKSTVTTTLVTGILTGVSSKNSEAAQSILLARKSGGTVHTLMADQEFMPQFYRAFFGSLVNNQKKMPLILMLAMGHGLKSVAVSMLTYYASWFDLLFKAQGITVDSPKYNRIRKGRVIRDTIRWVVTALESLRVAFANKYLSEKGKSATILLPGLGDARQFAPVEILRAYFVEMGNSDHASAIHSDMGLHPEICLDANNRPQPVFISEAMLVGIMPVHRASAVHPLPQIWCNQMNLTCLKLMKI
jgi:hypothetical protein